VAAGTGEGMTRPGTERASTAVVALLLGVAFADTAQRAPGFSLAGDSTARVALGIAAGWGLVAAALSLYGEGSRRVGRLLVLAGCAWLASGLGTPGARTSVLFTLGLAAAAVAPALIGWALLASAGDRLRAPDRVVVGTLWAAAALLGPLPALAYDPASEGCADCPSNLLGLVDAPDTVTALSRAGLGLGLLAAGACLALTIVRLVRAPTARRRRTWILVVPGCAYLALVAAELAHAWPAGYLGNDPLEQAVWTAQAAALLAMAVGVGLLRLTARRRRARLAGLVVELGGAPRAGALRDALADVLGDPQLALVHASPDGWLDASGLVSDPPPGASTTPLVRDGADIALIHHRPGLLDEPRTVAEIERAVRLGLDHERLQAQLRHQLGHLRRSRADLTAASEAERRSLERDLHDGAQQRLAAVTFAIGLARNRVQDPLDTRLARAQRDIQDALEGLREIAHGLYPIALAEEGLGAAVESLADRRPGLHPTALPTERFAPAVEETAYFVIATTADHWSPKPVSVAIERAEACVRVDLRAPAPPPDDVVGIADRVGALEGALAVGALGNGWTRVVAELPCE